ncbi:MAG: hypothetical protein V8R50_00320 [Clostridia bacterium]
MSRIRREKITKEIAEARKNITKEQTHYQNALSKLLKQIESVSEGDLTDLLAKKSEIEATFNISIRKSRILIIVKPIKKLAMYT